MHEYLQEIALKQSSEALALLLPVVGAVAWSIIKLGLSKVQQACDFISSRNRALTAVARRDTPAGPQEGQGVWTLAPIHRPEGYKNSVESCHILSIVNLKGGVGKTTIAANVAAHFASSRQWRRRVLLVDLDYQGSLSSMAFPDDTSWIPPAGTDSVATRALGGELQPSLFLAACKEVRQEPRLKVVTSYYDLAQADNRLMIEWLLNVRKADSRSWRHWLSDLFKGRAYEPNEMRFNLAKLLHSDAVKDAFDIIIIDCPPRLTSGAIQSLCASSHVLIPTILDKPSAESVVTFCTQLDNMRVKGLCPYLKHVGVVATRYVERHRHIDEICQKVTDDLKARSVKCGFLPKSTFIPQTVQLIRGADEGIAYYSLGSDAVAQNTLGAFAELARHIAIQVGVAPQPAYERENSEPVQLSLIVAAE